MISDSIDASFFINGEKTFIFEIMNSFHFAFYILKTKWLKPCSVANDNRFLAIKFCPRGHQSRASGNDKQKSSSPQGRAICIDTMSIQYRYDIDTISIWYNTQNTQNSQKYPKNTQNTQKYLEIPKNTQKYSRIPKSTRKYLKVP